MSLADQYLKVVEENIETVVREEWRPLRSAADVIAEAILDGHTVYEAPAGHMMQGETAPGRRGRPTMFAPLNSKDVDRLKPGDVLVMSNQYGVLERYVDLAIAAKARGATLVAMAPRSDPTEIVRSHPSGTTVTDHADIVIDTHIPLGDAAIPAPSGSPGSCPTSATIQAMLYWALTCGVAQRLAEAGRPPDAPDLSAPSEGAHLP